MSSQVMPIGFSIRFKTGEARRMPTKFVGKPLINLCPPPIARPTARPTARPILPAFQRARLRAKVGAITCSESWADTAAASAEEHGINPNIANVASQLRDRGVYPPRADLGPDQRPRTGAVRMLRCDGCARIVPPNNVASSRMVRLCDDCRIDPESDIDARIDARIDRGDRPRAPGAQLCTLMEGLVDEDANRDMAREQLHQIGLSDPEITAMSLTFAGYSTRSVAELGRWSQTYVRKLLTSAAQKLRRSGLIAPRPLSDSISHRPVSVDPNKLDAMTERVADRAG